MSRLSPVPSSFFSPNLIATQKNVYQNSYETNTFSYKEPIIYTVYHITITFLHNRQTDKHL